MDKDKFYVGEDGLEYCAVCQEPVEKYLPENVQEVFHMKTHPRQCACVRAQMEKEKQERKEREHQQEVEKNTIICFPERAMREWNFANDIIEEDTTIYAKWDKEARAYFYVTFSDSVAEYSCKVKAIDGTVFDSSAK